jgi:hypothetical protein
MSKTIAWVSLEIKSILITGEAGGLEIEFSR